MLLCFFVAMMVAYQGTEVEKYGNSNGNGMVTMQT